MSLLLGQTLKIKHRREKHHGKGRDKNFYTHSSKKKEKKELSVVRKLLKLITPGMH